MELEQCINFVLTRAQQAVLQLFKAELAPYGVTPVQYGVLRCLWDENGQTVKQLADRLALDSSTMTGILDRMEQKGLIVKQPDPRDRRALQIMLTERGQSLKEPLTAVIEEANRKAMQSLTDAEKASLRELLQKLEGQR